MTLKYGSNPVWNQFWNIGTCRIPHFGTSSHLTQITDLRFFRLPGPTRICGTPPRTPWGVLGAWGSVRTPLWTPLNFDLDGREGRPQTPPPHEGQAFLPTSPLVDRPRGTDFASRPMVHHRPRAEFSKTHPKSLFPIFIVYLFYVHRLFQK